MVARGATAGVGRLLPGPLPAWVAFDVDLQTVAAVTAVALVAGVVAGIAPAVAAVGGATPHPLGAARGSATAGQARTQRVIVVRELRSR